MGYRTIVILSNDDTGWGNTDLGKAIQAAASRRLNGRNSEINFGGSQIGTVLQCEHADTESIVHFSSLHGTTLGRSFYNSRTTEEEQREAMIVQIAESMGYTLVKN